MIAANSSVVHNATVPGCYLQPGKILCGYVHYTILYETIDTANPYAYNAKKYEQVRGTRPSCVAADRPSYSGRDSSNDRCPREVHCAPISTAGARRLRYPHGRLPRRGRQASQNSLESMLTDTERARIKHMWELLCTLETEIGNSTNETLMPLHKIALELCCTCRKLLSQRSTLLWRNPNGTVRTK